MANVDQIRIRNPPENSPYPAVDDPEIIGRILYKLDAVEGVTELAYDIASTVEATNWIIGKRRSTVAATTVYVAGRLLGESKPVFKQKEVIEASGVSKTSVSTMHDELLEVYQAVSGE